MKNLEKKKVPELQALYAQHVGETTRSPNKTFLIRKIKEALKAKPKRAKQKATESIEALQKEYAEAVGRPTTSKHALYLKWKIRQAKAGKIRVGPPLERISGPVAILPFRIPKDDVDALDGAVERHGIRSRNEFLRQAVHALLKKLGEADVAARFAS
jgi:hypothetical protein